MKRPKCFELERSQQPQPETIYFDYEQETISFGYEHETISLDMNLKRSKLEQHKNDPKVNNRETI